MAGTRSRPSRWRQSHNGSHSQRQAFSVAEARNSGAAVMANVLNPEPESITLNTELELPTLEPATELEQPSSESTSNTETAEAVVAVEPTALDADALPSPLSRPPPGKPAPRPRS